MNEEQSDRSVAVKAVEKLVGQVILAVITPGLMNAAVKSFQGYQRAVDSLTDEQSDTREVLETLTWMCPCPLGRGRAWSERSPDAEDTERDVVKAGWSEQTAAFKDEPELAEIVLHI